VIIQSVAMAVVSYVLEATSEGLERRGPELKAGLL